MNALDAMSSGGELRIGTSYIRNNPTIKETHSFPSSDTNSNDYVRIRIADTGLGMGAEHIKNLFSPFFSTKEFGKGTGLGLAICKEIVESHGGAIRVTSEPSKGSEFTILFPITSVQKDQNEEAKFVDRR
jgi:signal transduction histidine kinase